MQVVFYYLLRRVMISSYTSGRFSFRCSSSICLRSLKRSASSGCSLAIRSCTSFLCASICFANVFSSLPDILTISLRCSSRCSSHSSSPVLPYVTTCHAAGLPHPLLFQLFDLTHDLLLDLFLGFRAKCPYEFLYSIICTFSGSTSLFIIHAALQRVRSVIPISFNAI